MWPDTEPVVAELIADLRARAERHDQALHFGYRAHVIVRETETETETRAAETETEAEAEAETEAETRAAAVRLVSRLDDRTGDEIRQRSLDSASVGVRRQAELREVATDDGFVEDHLWTSIGRARSGCGAAIVGDPDQVRAKLQRYADLGIESFILSGDPTSRSATASAAWSCATWTTPRSPSAEVSQR